MNLRCSLIAELVMAIFLLPMALAQRALVSIDSATVAEQYLLSAANQERTARGLSELRRDPHLAKAAAGHARAMVTHGSISHRFQGEAELTSRGASAGVPFSLISENVAEAPNVVQIQEMWMSSDHHRANLLDPTIDSAGISVIRLGDELYAVEDFVRSVRLVSLEDQESAIAALVSQAGRVVAANDSIAITEARQTCAAPTGFVGTHQPWFIMRFTSTILTQLPNQLKTRLASGRYHRAAIGACAGASQSSFTSYNFAVLLYP